MDSVKNINFKMRNTFFYSVISIPVKDEIGIHTASGVLQNQGWLIWLNDSKGVYDLYLLPSEHDNAASYLLKYYPSPDEDLFSGFSKEEQHIRKTCTFEKGAPKYGERESTMADHFIIGALDILWEDNSIWLHLSVLDDDNRGRSPELPVLQMSHNFFTILLRTLCFLTKTPPSMVLSRATQTEPGKTARQFTTILLPGETNKKAVTAELCKTIGVRLNGVLVGEDGTALWEPLYLEGAAGKSANPSPFIDPKWWTLPARGETILPKELRI